MKYCRKSKCPGKCYKHNCLKSKDICDVYLYLGKYLYNLLSKLNLPCDHPSLEDSIKALICGAELPPGHPSLNKLILLAIKKDEGCCCKPYKSKHCR